MKYKLNVKKIENSIAYEANLNPKNEVLEGFLMSSVYNREMADWFTEGIDKVLNGVTEYEEYDGEIFGTEIRKDKTRVYDTFSVDEEKVIESYVETEELKELIQAWIKELENQNP